MSMQNDCGDEPAVLKRAPGRPPSRSEDETRKLVMDAAVAEFVAVGAARGSMARIARRAGISTRTLYKFALGKEELFRLAIEQRIEEVLAATFAPLGKGDCPRDELTRLLLAYANLLLNDEVVATTRVVISETSRIPDLAESFRRSGRRLARVFDSLFTEICANYELDIHSASDTAKLVRWTLSGIQRQQLLKSHVPVGQNELVRIVDRLVDLICVRC